MKKTYKIDVDCANCANKMEEAARKTPGVQARHRELYDPEDDRGVCRGSRPQGGSCRRCARPAKRWRTTARYSSERRRDALSHLPVGSCNPLRINK